jgi:hypothetical protein
MRGEVGNLDSRPLTILQTSKEVSPEYNSKRPRIVESSTCKTDLDYLSRVFAEVFQMFRDVIEIIMSNEGAKLLLRYIRHWL